MKATEGLTYTDPSFNANWAGSHAAGLTRGAYHFGKEVMAAFFSPLHVPVDVYRVLGHPSMDAVAQANYFVDAVNAAGGYAAGSKTLQFVLDLEDADGLGAAAVWSWVQAFMGQVHARTGRPG